MFNRAMSIDEAVSYSLRISCFRDSLINIYKHKVNEGIFKLLNFAHMLAENKMETVKGKIQFITSSSSNKDEVAPTSNELQAPNESPAIKMMQYYQNEIQREDLLDSLKDEYFQITKLELLTHMLACHAKDYSKEHIDQVDNFLNDNKGSLTAKLYSLFSKNYRTEEANMFQMIIRGNDDVAVQKYIDNQNKIIADRSAKIFKTCRTNPD